MHIEELPNSDSSQAEILLLLQATRFSIQIIFICLLSYVDFLAVKYCTDAHH
jgi:hypothetical protein